MPHYMLRVVAFALSLAAASSEVARPLAAQDGAEELSERAPRFLAALTPKPILVDVARMPVLQRRIALDLRGATLADALQAIGDSSGLRIAYSRVELPVDQPVRLQARDITVAAALTEVLLGLGVDAVFNKRGQAMLVRRDREGRVRESGALVGRVTDATTGAGVALAEIFLSGTEHRATSDTGGRFRLVGIDTGMYTLTARRPGYRKESRRVVVHDGGEDTVDVALTPAAVTLNELVTTATGQQRRRDIGNSITTIKADSVLRTAPIRNLTDLLENRVPGMSLRHTSGAPGDPARIRLRGLGSVMRSNDPVVVVDGVRVYAAQTAARSGNLTNLVNPLQSLPAPSPLDQIDPNTIERVEVFKGPSAATLYGADAANGVIVITTKHGKPGPTRWQVSLTRSREVAPGRWPTGYYNFGHNIDGGFPQLCQLTDRRCVSDSLVLFQALNEPELTALGRGGRTALSLTASGGSQTLIYSLTGSYAATTGLLQLPAYELERFRIRFNREAPDWMRRPHQLTEWSVASNVGARLGATADVRLVTMLSRTRQERSSLEGGLGQLATTYLDRVNGVSYGYTSGGLVSLDSSYLTGYYTRTTASQLSLTSTLSAEWHPRPWMTAISSAGLNVIPRDDQQLLPSGLVTAADSGTFSRGTGQSLVSTFNLQSTFHRPLRWGFVFETSLGANLKTETTADLAIAAAGLVPGTSTIGSTSRLNAVEARNSSSVFGWYVEPRITGQRLSLSTGLRLDGGNTYGTRMSGLGNLLALPKLNGSWLISEEPWFPFASLFSSLRLRGEYGQAQVQPGPAARLRLYQYSTGEAGRVKLTTLGNTQLRPERATELGGGFDADLLDSRVSLEFTVYRKTQVDALMPLTLPPSVNGAGAVPYGVNIGSTVLTNIGTIRNAGVELTLGVIPVQRPALTWNTRVTYSHNDNKLASLGEGVAPNPQQGLVAGYPVGGRWECWLVGFVDENRDGVINQEEVRVSDSLRFVGGVLPKHQMALFSDVTLLGGAVAVSTGFSYESGATQRNTISNAVLQRAVFDPAASLREQAIVAAGNLAAQGGFVDEVSIFRFNTLSVSYRAPRRVARLLGADQLSMAMQGSNLALHTSYRGKDPDVTAWSPSEDVRDVGQLPQSRTWQLRVDLQY